MSNQDFAFTIPLTATAANALSVTIPQNFGILRNNFSGPSAPLSPLADQGWHDTTNGTRRVYDGAAWQHTGPARGRPCPIASAVLSASATGTQVLCCHEHSAVVTGLGLFHKASTTSDGSNLWTWQLRNLTASLELFAAAPDTNGDDLVANTRKLLTPDQNLVVAAGDGLQFEYTKTGSATALSELLVVLYGYLATP